MKGRNGETAKRGDGDGEKNAEAQRGKGAEGTNGPNGDKCVTISVANLGAKDAEFLTGVIDIFCNPMLSPRLRALREGKVSLRMNPKTGVAYLVRDWPDYLPALE